MKILQDLTVASAFLALSFSAFADQTSCYNINYPSPPAPELKLPPAGGAKTVTSAPPAGDGYHTPMKMKNFELSLYGVELGRKYSDEELKGVFNRLSDYGVKGSLSSAKGKPGHRYTQYGFTAGGLKVGGYHDNIDGKYVFYSASRAVFGEKIDWIDLKKTLQSRYGEGFTERGSNQENFAAIFKDGSGGWSKEMYEKCARKFDCKATAKLKYRNNFIRNSSGGICVTDHYEISVMNREVANEVYHYERNESRQAAQRAADNMQLSKPKM